jgi:hypothetical protein
VKLLWPAAVALIYALAVCIFMAGVYEGRNECRQTTIVPVCPAHNSGG